MSVCSSNALGVLLEHFSQFGSVQKKLPSLAARPAYNAKHSAAESGWTQHTPAPKRRASTDTPLIISGPGEPKWNWECSVSPSKIRTTVSQVSYPEQGSLRCSSLFTLILPSEQRQLTHSYLAAGESQLPHVENIESKTKSIFKVLGFHPFKQFYIPIGIKHRRSFAHTADRHVRENKTPTY